MLEISLANLDDAGPVTVKVFGREHRQELYWCERGRDWFCAAWDMSNWLRGRLDHDDLSEAEVEVYDKVQEMLYECVRDNGVSFDDVE